MKKPSEEFESLMQFVRIVSTPLGANVVDPNYKVNPRIITTLVFIALFIIFSFLTFLRMYNGDWTIAMEVFSTIGTCINGIAKTASVLKYSDLYADTYIMLLDVYVTYEKLGENYCQIMRKLCARCRKIIKFVGFAYIAYTVTVIVTPFFLLAYNGKRQIILQFLLPQMDLSTDFGYFFNLTFQACCVIIAGFGLYTGDLLVFIYLTHAILYTDITKLKVQALNVKIESTLQSSLNSLNIDQDLKDIICWHQNYEKFLTTNNCMFYWAISVTVLCAVWSCINTLYLILTSDWPGAYTYLILSFTQLYTYCLLGSQTEICNEELCHEMYNIRFYELTPIQQNTVRLMLTRSQTPLSIDIANVLPLSVSTGLRLPRVLFLTLLYQLVNAQDYQDYQENTPRAAPARLRPHTNLVEADRTAHVAILKQINKHNEDGSYTYGYEGADGSFKIETKLATGEVKGKYGYVDETGKVRVVEYGANQYGFQPSGEGITVAPPTLVDESAREAPDYEDELVNRPQKAYRIQRPQQQTRTAPPPPPPVQPSRQHIQPQYVQYVEEEEEPAPEPPRRIQYVPQSAPVSQRALQIPGAQRSTQVLYSPLGKENRPESEYSQQQTYGDGGSNFRISRPVYAPPPMNPAPSSARAHGFLAPASGGRPLLSAADFGPSTTPRPQPQAIPAQLRYFTQPQYQLQPQHQHQNQHQQQPQHQPQPQQVQYQPQYTSQLQAQSQPRAQSQPHPHPQPQPQAQPHSMHQLQGRSGGSLLDQLARDYALPQSNSQPLHDISFGYY